MLILGDCLEEMKKLPDNSVDSIVTDPPYGLSFMGKKWDYDVPSKDIWVECLRVLKPGGHLLSFAGSRTYHRMTVNIEDAGFEVRDMITWNYGSGFPKSLNISLQIKKKYSIGLCTCYVFEPMIELGHENCNNKRDYISNGNDDGLSIGEQIQCKGTDNNEVAEQGKNTNLSPNSSIRKESEVCELPETDSQKEQGLKEVGESILRSGVCQSIPKDKGLGNTTIRAGVEANKTTGKGEGQTLQVLRENGQEQSPGSSPDSIQNGGKELNGEPCEPLSELPQQSRENNRKRIEQIKNDCGSEEWRNLSRFICAKCYCLKKDIGGTALKPSIEPICVARKPLGEATVALNVLKYGTGGLNIDGCRVGTEERFNAFAGNKDTGFTVDDQRTDTGKGLYAGNKEGGNTVTGRFPANFIHDGSDEVVALFPETKPSRIGKPRGTFKTGMFANSLFNKVGTEHNDSGSAARFFYCAKASKADRDEGLTDFVEQLSVKMDGGTFNSASTEATARKAKNHHPTVKPTELMRYLCKLVTPPGGTVLDPFMGSGSTGKAAKLEGFDFIGIEKEAEYVEISRARIEAINTLF